MVEHVAKFGQLRSQQLWEMLFWELRSQTSLDRVLLRLVASNHLARVARPVGGDGGGSAQYFYHLGREGRRLVGRDPRGYYAPTPGSQHTAHRLAIVDRYVQVLQAARAGSFELLGFRPEPRLNVGTNRLTPDALMVLGFGERGSGEEVDYWLEVDRGTEDADDIEDKCVRYWRAYQQWQRDDVFPFIFFVVPDEQRARFIRGVIAGGPDEARDLFEVATFGDFIPALNKVL
ncbi:replication-relaxation family protein [Streptomyces sp. MBT56]|uniref:replication-relaxation family protein n=1 Tax=unclassified Streptomyces TaxID=2593676 RepID=UPI00190CAFE9|nr:MULTISPECIES: replication-relaxation family protein [unclassified Streptomyces]MBK3559776.1 replication-relaxation family protein [Streptomyces sp. MBT56]MBK3601282.1 replication-relaxation family protein [Streptomyces sp. MBT54]MBK3615271.1 replication-relaxation family protein [Streptomyces sp. MBT98]